MTVDREKQQQYNRPFFRFDVVALTARIIFMAP